MSGGAGSWRRAVPWALLLVLWLPYAWVASHYHLVQLLAFGDGWAHLTAIRRTLDQGLFPGDLFLRGEPTPPYYSLAHVFFAGASRLTGWAPHEVFVGAPPLIAAGIMAAVFLWLRALSGDVRVALGGAAIELLVAMPAPPWTSLSFPRSVAVAPLYLSWFAYVRARRSSSLAWLIAAGVALGACLATHLFTGGVCLIGLFVHAVVLAWPEPATSRVTAVLQSLRRSLAPFLVVVACGLAIASPWIGSFVYALGHRPPQMNHVFEFARESWVLVPGHPWLRVLQPRAFVSVLPAPLWIGVALGLGATVARCVRQRVEAVDRYAVSACIAALLLTFTPLFALGVAAFGVWAPRLVLVAPLSLLFGRGAAVLIDGVQGSRLGLRLVSAALLVWMTLGSLATIRDTAAQFPELSEGLRREGPLGTWDYAAQLEARGPLPRVILSDPDTSYLLPYLLGSYVVAMPIAHGSPYVDHEARQKAVREFYSRATLKRMTELLDRYDVDTVAISTSSSWPSEGMGAELLARLRRLPEFADTGCCGDVVFLRYTPRNEPVAPARRR